MASRWRPRQPVGALIAGARNAGLVDWAALIPGIGSAHQVLPSVFGLYAAYRYGWGETKVVLTLAFVGHLHASRAGVAARPRSWRGSGRGAPDRWIFPAGREGKAPDCDLRLSCPQGPLFWFVVACP